MKELHGYININRRILQAYNSCDNAIFAELIEDVMHDKRRDKIFTQKRYFWNRFRPKDYYRNMSEYVIRCIKSTSGMENPDRIADTMEWAEYLIKMVVQTTKNPEISKSFIWKIMKQVPLLTVDTIQFCSAEKIHQLLTSDKQLICDDKVKPFVDVVMDYRSQISALQSIVDNDV